MYFIKVVLISLVLLINKNSSAHPEDHTTDQNKVEKCSSDKKVCGTDGKTYRNICLLQKETGVKLAHEGNCTSGKNGKKKTAYIPDLILKSKIVNTTGESLQKKLVKHFNPITGKWEYVIEILPTIVITPTFHHLKIVNNSEIPSSYNKTNVKTNADLKTVDLPSPVNASTELDVKNLPTFLGKTSGGMFPKRNFTNDKYSREPFIRNKNLSEIIENRTKNFPRSQVENRFSLPKTNETFPSVRKLLSGNPLDVLPTVSPLESFNTSEIKPPFKDVLLKNDSIGNHTNKVQSTVNRTLPEKPITEWDKSLKLPKKATKNHKTHQILIKKNSNLHAPFVQKPHALHHYKPYLPVHKVNPHRASEPKINIVLKPPHKNVSSPHPTTVGNTTHIALNISQPIKNNLTLGTLSPKIPEDHQKPVTNVYELLGKETVPPITPVKDSAMNISQPITNITGLKDLSMKVNLHRDSEPKINIVLKPPHKNVSSPHPTTMDNTTHTALNISQPIMNNLTLGTLSPKIPEDHQKPVTNVSELLGKETVPPITPVKDSAMNISQPITNLTGLKYLSMKDEYNPVRNTSQPIKEEPVSGDHPSGKLNIIPAPKKTEEIPKIKPNNGPNTHQIQPSFHPGHSKLLHSAVRIPKLHGWIPPKNIPSIIENKGENFDQTKPNIDTKPKSNTKWGTYYIKLPGNVSDNIDLVINWEVLNLKTNQPNLTINVSEMIGSKNYTWPKDSRYATDTSIYHKLRSGSLKPINEKIKRVVNNDVWHNTNSRHPQSLVNTRKSGDVPINVTKTAEIKSYQLEDEVTLKGNRKSDLLQDLEESKLGAYRYVNPSLQLPRSKKFGHNLEKYGSYSLDLPRNVAGNFKLIFTWTLRNKLPKSMRSPIDVTEKQVKYDYKWKIGGTNKRRKQKGNEKIQPIKSVNVHETPTPIKHFFGERGLIGRQGPRRRLHDLAQGLGNFHHDIPKTTTKPQLDTSAPVKTEEITPTGTKLYPGWYYMEMLFNVPGGGGGGCSANNNNCTNLNNYNDTRKSQMDPTDLLSFNRSMLTLLPINDPSFLNNAIEHAKAHQGKCNCNNDKTIM